MPKYDISKSKINKLWENITFNEFKINLLKEFDIRIGSMISPVRNVTNTISHSPVIYDLYRYLGVTYTNDVNFAVPAELYTANENNSVFTFNLPTYGYAVPFDVDPNELLGTVNAWEYQVSVAIIKTKINYTGLTSDIVRRANLVTLLETDSNITIPSLQVLIDPIKEIYTDFSYFYRWIELASSYDLEIYAFYPLTNNVNLTMTTNITFFSKGAFNEIQSNQIKNIQTQ